MTAPAAGDPPGVFEPSPGRLGGDGLAPLPADERPRRWSGLLVWSATSAPVGLLLISGTALGPGGINLLSLSTLTLLDPVVPVALAAFGVHIGLSVNDRRSDDARTFASACLAAAITVLVVSAGFGVLGLTAISSVARPFWILVLTAGICAASSLTLPSEDSLEPKSAATRVVELGVLLPLVAGGLVLAWLHAGSAAAAGSVLAQACGLTLAVAAAAWLLLTRTTTETDRRVFAVSALLLVGGVAAALSLSALLGGLVAGLFWRCAARHPRETIRRDVLFVQHPLLVLVLLLAGARADLSSSTLAAGAGYVVLRVAGQLAAGTTARRLARTDPGDLGRHLLPPGVLGVALALNTISVVGADATLLLATVVVGTVGCELVAVLLPPRSVAA
jgi:hypothetical protein